MRNPGIRYGAPTLTWSATTAPYSAISSRAEIPCSPRRRFTATAYGCSGRSPLRCWFPLCSRSENPFRPYGPRFACWPRPTARRQRHLPERRSFSFRSRRRLPEARSKACGIWGSATVRPMCWTPRAAWRTGSLISLRFANARMRNSFWNYRAYTASGRRSRTA